MVIVGDLPPDPNEAPLEIRFLGKVRGFASGAARMAEIARAPLLSFVCEYTPPFGKTWETQGEPHLLVIGKYRMGFKLEPVQNMTRLCVWLDYDLPTRRLPWLGKRLAKVYADWCVKRMSSDAVYVFKCYL